MKKKVFSLILSLVMLCSIAFPAFAAEDEGISILYNGKYIAFDDVAPQNVNGRVMLPFRKILETMGASVDYSDETNTVTAVKDNAAISFGLSDSAIQVKNGDQINVFNMDVPIVIENNRALVPVRFIAEALGMSVNWDSANKTVVIVDINQYLSQLKATASNFYEMLEMPVKIPQNYSSNMVYSFKFNMESNMTDASGTPSVASGGIDFSMTSDSAYKNDVISSKNIINMNCQSLVDYIQKMGGMTSFGVDFEKLTGITLDFILDKDTIYIKTNLVEKLAEATNDAAIDAAATVISGDTWMSIKISELVSMILGDAQGRIPSGISSLIDGFVKEGTSNFEGKTTLSILLSALDGVNYDVETAKVVDMLFNMYSQTYSDGSFVLTKTSDTAYTVSYKLSSEAYKNMLKSVYDNMLEDLDDEEKAEALEQLNAMIDSIVMDATMTMSVEDGMTINAVSSGTYSMSVPIDNNNSFKISLSFDMTESGAKDSVTENIEVPSNSIDIKQLMNLVQGLN